MSKAIRLVLAAFATYRCASLIASEEGPYIGWPKSKQQTGIFQAIRARLGAYDYGENSLPETALGRGISCPLCVGIYVCFALMFLVFLPSKLGDFFLAWMGVAGAQVFLENLTSDEAIQEAIEDVAESIEE